MPLFILAVIALLVWLMLPGRGQSGITGSGSTLAQPLIQQAARDYRDAAAADNPERVKQTGRDWVLNGSGIDYEAIGSLGGILRLSDPEVDFAIADYPLTAAALSEKRVEQFPIAVGAIAIVANLDLPQGTALRLDAPTLADIFRGAVTSWQDPAITAANPGLELPDAPITSVHRTDGSGSTLGLTTWLSAHSADFRSAPGAGQSLTWPAGTGAERSSGMISTLQQTAGSIGYVELGQGHPGRTTPGRRGRAGRRLRHPLVGIDERSGRGCELVWGAGICRRGGHGGRPQRLSADRAHLCPGPGRGRR